MLTLNQTFNEKKNVLDFSLEKVIEESQRISFPSWPLQNTVAVNPFWYYRDQDFDSALANLSQMVQTNLMLPLSRFLAKFDSKQISTQSLIESLSILKEKYPKLPSQLEDFLEVCRFSPETLPEKVPAFADYLDRQKLDQAHWGQFISSEVSKWAAGYLDQRQSIIQPHDQSSSFWEAWFQGQSYDPSMELKGPSAFRKYTESFKNLSALEAISKIIASLELFDSEMTVKYFQTLLTSVLGWSTAFKYLEWQKQLGYKTERSTSLTEFLAVRLIYDYILLQITIKDHPHLFREWIDTLRDVSTPSTSFVPEWQLQYVFQLATEFEYQKQIAAKLNNVDSRSQGTPKAQLIFCIDVRSEMLRRHIELENPEVQTLGFAGFFGIPISYQDIEATEAESRLPVLLKPDFKAKEVGSNSRSIPNISRINEGYFRNLRKNSLSSFAYVEFFGASYIFEMLNKAKKQLVCRRNGDEVPSQWKKSQNHEIELQPLLHDQNVPLSDRINRVAQILRHLGLTEGFSELVFIVGHGSATTNNAFASALACGACGGHSGDVNARLLAQLLNDPEIREGLKVHSIHIPNETSFIAAIHDTVTDEIYPFNADNLSSRTQTALDKLVPLLKNASENTRKQRLTARSNILDSNSNRRTQNWSEIRPEWGLAGNACFIVAPRMRTRGVDLNSRAFLHDYDWKQDQKRNYQTLELIMTAPMIVTNWINLQYYASTVAPNVYGAGNKLIHNLVNEVGVVEGNGGDLRVGLPQQSVHDGSKFVHEPLRLTVFIEAPLEEIEKIIQKHITVRDLIEHEWLHLVHIDPFSLTFKRRQRNGNYVEVLGNDLNKTRGHTYGN